MSSSSPEGRAFWRSAAVEIDFRSVRVDFCVMRSKDESVKDVENVMMQDARIVE